MRNQILAMSSAAVAVAALSLIGTAPASAYPRLPGTTGATVVCGPACFDMSSQFLGNGRIQQSLAGGIYLQPGSLVRSSQDFEYQQVGTLGTLCGVAGGIPLTSYVCKKFAPALGVWEWVWSPFGNQTGLCEAAAKAIPLQAVILQSCALPSVVTDLWVPDSARGFGPGTCLLGRHCPWYNAAGTLAVPVVLRVRNIGGQLILAHPGASAIAGPRRQFCIKPGPFGITPLC